MVRKRWGVGRRERIGIRYEVGLRMEEGFIGKDRRRGRAPRLMQQVEARVPIVLLSTWRITSCTLIKRHLPVPEAGEKVMTQSWREIAG